MASVLFISFYELKVVALSSVQFSSGVLPASASYQQQQQQRMRMKGDNDDDGLPLLSTVSFHEWDTGLTGVVSTKRRKQKAESKQTHESYTWN